MTKNMKNSFLLLLSITLTACGLAEPSAPYETDPDETPPSIIGSTPLNNGILEFDDVKITLMLDETIDPASLDMLNTLIIRSSAGIVLNGSWSFEEPDHRLIFTLDDRDSVPANQQFTIQIDGEVTDIAGNPLITNRQFSTPSLFNIEITNVAGLANDDSLEITQTLSGSTETNIITLNGDSEDITVSGGLIKGDIYSLTITQAAQNSFCVLPVTGGEIISRNIRFEIKCHNVMPTYPNESKWNQYVEELPDAHGGELKKVTFQSLLNCDVLNAEDALGAFDWVCSKEGTTDEVTFFSEGLKADKGLSDLVNFGAPAGWKGNRLIVRQGDAEVYDTSEGIWWTNHVVAISNESTLTSEGTIYLIQEGSNLAENIHISGNGIALLIDKNVNYEPAGNASGIRVSGDAIWVEGKVNARSSTVGIQVTDTKLAVLRYVTVENARGSGFEILNGERTQIINSASTNNSGHGIYISTSRLAQIRNTTSSMNRLSGITIVSPMTTTIDFTGSYNGGDGIVIAGSNNRVFETSTHNNVRSGLVLLGANNNMINAITIASNGGSGLQFEQSGGGVFNSRNNLFRDITIADNAGKGILFDTLSAEAHTDNRLINVLDAHNLESECPDTTCNSVTTVSAEDISLADLFNSEAPWQLNSVDNSYALNQLSSDDIEPVNTHTFLGAEELTFLNNAKEILGDNIGNDNSLCEVNENCIFTPNIGNYQGHGDIIPLENSTNSLSATLFMFSENGR